MQVNQEAEIFRSFAVSAAHAGLVDISQEVILLLEMKDVLGELGIMNEVFEAQQEIFQALVPIESTAGFSDMSRETRLIYQPGSTPQVSLKKIWPMRSLVEAVVRDVCLFLRLPTYLLAYLARKTAAHFLGGIFLTRLLVQHPRGP